MIRRRIIVALSALGMVHATRALAQSGTGTIAGQVSDRDSQEPVVGAAVEVVGSSPLRMVRTTADGHFSMPRVPAGKVELRALRVGYAAATTTVTVPDGGTVRANFTLARVATQLNQVVTTATSETQSRRETGANIAVVPLDSIAQAPITDFSDALTGRTSGVVVEHASGEVGTGSTVRIRGASSLYLSNEPIYIIDGVRLDNSASTFNISLGGQSPSRLDEIPEEDIESFEILKGPTAAALYGTAAANGIVSITTKHGEGGATHWDFFAEGGNNQNATHFPDNWGTLTTNTNFFAPPGYPEATNCTLTSQAQYVDGDTVDGCVPDASKYKGGIVRFNPIADHSPYRIGQRGDLGLDVHGGSGTTTYFVSGSKTSQTGVYPNNGLNKATLRANANFQLTQDIGVAVTASYLTQRLDLPQNDNNYVGPLSDGYLGYPVENTQDGHGHPSYGYNPIPPSQDYQYQDHQLLDHYTAGATGNWHPLSWLTFTAVTGLDQDWAHNVELEPQDAVFVSPTDSNGHFASYQEVFQTLTENVAATATAHPFASLAARSTVGFQYYGHLRHLIGASGQGPSPGTGSLGQATQNEVASDTTQTIKQIGYLASEEFNWSEKRYVTLSIRADNNSSFGSKVGTEYYPAANASWVLSDEDFWPTKFVSLRARGAYGSSGLNPQSLDALSYYIGGAQKYAGVEATSITFGNIGLSGLKPERSDEFEGGLEWGFAQERVTFNATYYYKHTTDALVQTTLPGSVGASTTLLENLGSVMNEGIELDAAADIFRSRDFTFNLTGTFSGNRNRLLKLGTAAAYLNAAGTSMQRFQPGYSLGGFWAIPADSFPHQSANGLTGLENLYWNPAGSFVYRGSSIPTREASLTPTATLFRTLRLSALFDYRGGYSQFDASEQFRCTFWTCQGNNDPNDSWHDKVCASYAQLSNGAYVDCWIEDASFIKLREISATVTLPGRWAARVRASSLAVTVAGRNLWTLWTPWKGVDPEVDSFSQDNFGRYQFAVQPLTRYFMLRLDATF